jgi:hypothetical protein
VREVIQKYILLAFYCHFRSSEFEPKSFANSSKIEQGLLAHFERAIGVYGKYTANISDIVKRDILPLMFKDFINLEIIQTETLDLPIEYFRFNASTYDLHANTFLNSETYGLRDVYEKMEKIGDQIIVDALEYFSSEAGAPLLPFEISYTSDVLAQIEL